MEFLVDNHFSVMGLLPADTVENWLRHGIPPDINRFLTDDSSTLALALAQLLTTLLPFTFSPPSPPLRSNLQIAAAQTLRTPTAAPHTVASLQQALKLSSFRSATEQNKKPNPD
eukprot:gene16820-23099_t